MFFFIVNSKLIASDILTRVYSESEALSTVAYYSVDGYNYLKMLCMLKNFLINALYLRAVAVTKQPVHY